MKIEYNKLVRDKIPEIITGSGKQFSIRTLSEDEYREALRAKLIEECNEYLESGDKEELADILEVINALTKLHDSIPQDIEAIRERKVEERGGFEEWIMLEWVE